MGLYVVRSLLLCDIAEQQARFVMQLPSPCFSHIRGSTSTADSRLGFIFDH